MIALHLVESELFGQEALQEINEKMAELVTRAWQPPTDMRIISVEQDGHSIAVWVEMKWLGALHG